MGFQVIRQPDGLLAVFDSNKDEWIGFDLSPEAIVKWHAEQEEQRARKAMQEIVDRVVAGEPERVYHQFAMTFDEAQFDHAASGAKPVPFGFLSAAETARDHPTTPIDPKDA